MYIDNIDIGRHDADKLVTGSKRIIKDSLQPIASQKNIYMYAEFEVLIICNSSA